MTWVTWLIFCLDLLFKYGPKLVKAIREIIEDLDTRKNETGVPMSGSEKRKLADPKIARTMVAMRGAMPPKSVVAQAREWHVQRVRGRGWKCAPDVARDSGLDAYYNT